MFRNYFIFVFKFGYDEDKIIIKNFNADVKEGQKIAIVGPTGAGKTTMVKLLMRFYDVNSGEILVDGHNIKDFKRGDLRKMFGMVLQDTWLFGGTAIENNVNKENEKMTKTMNINGMMCKHCEAAVKKALEALPQVDSAVADHEKKTAVVTLNSDIDDSILKKTVEELENQVVSIS